MVIIVWKGEDDVDLVFPAGLLEYRSVWYRFIPCLVHTRMEERLFCVYARGTPFIPEGSLGLSFV